MRKIAGITCLLFLSFLILLTGCEKKEEGQNQTEKGEFTVENYPQGRMPENGDEIVILKTNMGDIKIMFFPEYAPKAVENFIALSRDGYYNGITFHRVINDFMIQGGDPTGTGSGGESTWGKSFEDEFSDMLYNFKGALSMANRGANTNGSQFFIVQKGPLSSSEASSLKSDGVSEDVISVYQEKGGTPWLDGKHTVFGQVFEGLDVVDEIAAVATGTNNKPLKDVVIESAEVTTYQG